MADFANGRFRYGKGYKTCLECRALRRRAATKPSRVCKHRTNLRAIVTTAKSGGCSICKDLRLVCLDMHHVTPADKTFAIARAVNSRMCSMEALQSELAKCIVLCVNCHRKTHTFPAEIDESIKKTEYGRLRRLRRRVFVDRIKTKRGCLYCKETNPVCLEFHHRDPASKSFTIGQAVSGGVKYALLNAEIAKCDVICGNCHRCLHTS